ncbi:uncharacterized protein LOC143064225 isoform X2 [Mytilus galloprovincialis]|uniref:uncharacterized protein LOC143064225 isoform X2 n=1 Tax=Mytilus galloprovincialis TaxID=29158 RepID=UPI003F7BA9FC
MILDFFAFVLCILRGIGCLSPPISDKETSIILPGLEGPHNLSYSFQLHHTRVGFKHRWVNQSGGCYTTQPNGSSIAVDATTAVSDEALSKACTIIGLMIKHMSTEIFEYSSRGHGVGVFAKSDGMGVYPENANVRDTPECNRTCNGTCSHTCTFDGRKYASIAGLTNSRSVVLEDNILCNDKDPYNRKESICVHEFAHQVFKHLPTSYKNRFAYIYHYDKQHKIWKDGYGMATSAEFWAEASSAWFHTAVYPGLHSPSVGLDLCNFDQVCGSEMENRQWLRTHDPSLYNLLSKVYTNNQPFLPSGLKVCI